MGRLGGAMDLDPSSSDLIDFKSFVAREDDGIVRNVLFYDVAFEMKNLAANVLYFQFDFEFHILHESSDIQNDNIYNI